MSHTSLPSSLAALAVERIRDLDVRAQLARGEEPFSQIMAARQELAPGDVLRLRALFEPVPLYAVMARFGFDHWTEELAPDDWRVWFYQAGDGADARTDPPPSDAGAAADEGDDAGIVVLDVRGMEPPEPMVRTLAALETLPQGGTLVQVNERVPRFLLPRLDALGFEHEIRAQEGGVFRVFIRRRPS